jgi:hypothetical protein
MRFIHPYNYNDMGNKVCLETCDRAGEVNELTPTRLQHDLSYNY